MLSNVIVDDQAQQQLLALRQANRVRVARAELKRKVAKEELSVAEIVVGCPWEAASMEIGDLIRSQRRWGAARCRRLLVVRRPAREQARRDAHRSPAQGAGRGPLLLPWGRLRAIVRACGPTDARRGRPRDSAPSEGSAGRPGAAWLSGS